MRKNFFGFFVLILLASVVFCSCTSKSVDAKSSAPPSQDTKKETMDEAEKKLSSQLLQLENEAFLPAGATKEQLVSAMKEQGQIKDVQKDGKSVTAVYVYIEVNNEADISMLDTYVLETVNTDKNAKLISVWIEVARLKEMASLEQVKSIEEVTKPETEPAS